MTGKKLSYFYDRISGQYDSIMNVIGYTLINKIIFKTLPNHFITPDVLDMGCGTGITTRLIEKKYQGATITGLDGSDRMLDIYYQRYPQNRLLMGDFNQEKLFYSYPDREITPLMPGSFDIIISSGAVMEYGILDKAFTLIHKLLRPGGMMIIIGTKKSRLSDFTGAMWWKYQSPPTQEVLSIIKQTGFSNIRNNSDTVHFPIGLIKEIIIAHKAS